MSNFAKFMKGNKVERKNVQLAVTKSIIDPETGKPVLWTIRPITTKENDSIRDECTVDVPIPGKTGQYRQKTKSNLYLKKLICASIAEPNLYDKDLQDSYGVKTPEELIDCLIDDPGEYNALIEYITQLNHLDSTLEDKVDEAKN